MSNQTQEATSSTLGKGAKRFGYTVSIAVNALLLFFVNSVLDWGLFSFLTDDFELVLPILNFSLGLGIVLNAVYLITDPPLLKSSTQLFANVVSVFVMVRMLQVFPFDFSGFSFDWSWVVRLVLIVGAIGTGIAVIVELVKTVRLLSTADVS